ncbi:MAG: amino acid-binding protein [Rhodobiaceae bacterium]|nr:amino acid-binding protein [Rhodobiaceae bacterium]MCC0012812.1 amino acid-binding protein [Rhodobiaceae bacterium]MCC0060161.1 amino acid-binding protein [Rhodobiaceae bacterium]
MYGCSDFRQILLRLCIVVAAVIPCTHARSSDEIVVGVPYWPSAEATANIIGEIIESRLGVDARLQPTGTLGIFVGIDKGEIQIHPEIWRPNLNKLITKYSTEHGTLTLAANAVSAAQEICVTKGTAELTGIKSVQDLANPDMAAKFDSDGDGKGEIWIGAPTWSSTLIEQIRARSYGYEKTMTLLQAPEDVAMANVDAAIAVGRPVVFFCYEPHHVFKLHEIVVLDEPPHDPANWHIVLPGEDPEWLSKSMAGSAWDKAEFHIGYASSLTASAPRVAGLLEKITFTPEEIIDMTYAISVERKSPPDVAASWIAANEDKIEGWVK